MKTVDDLIEGAAELAEQGRSRGEIADELNVSRETASWLVDRSEADGDTDQEPAVDDPAGSPRDIHVDWSAIGRDSRRLEAIAVAMADLLESHAPAVDLTVGIEKAGTPLASLIGRELDTDLATYTPAKHQWEAGDIGDLGGTFSHNFADIRDRECYVVDDTITSGTTLGETIGAIREEGGEPLACVVLADKRGIDEVDGVPVHSLVRVISVDRTGE